MRTSSPRLALLLVPVLALSFAGCGRKLSPLTAAQKDRFRATLEGVVNTGGALTRQTRSWSEMLDAASEYEKLSQAIRDAVQAGKCSVASNLSTAKWKPSQFEFPDQRVTIEGDQCPIAFSYAAGGRANHQQGELGFELGYHVRDADVRKLADIGAITLKGKAEYRVVLTGATIKLGLGGTLSSLQEGDLRWYLTAEGSGSRDGGSGELVFGIDFRDFTAELKIKASSPNDLEFYVNDEQVSPEEFQKLVDSLKIRFDRLGR